MSSWQQWKEAKLFDEINTPPEPGSDGAEAPLPPKPSHPEIAHQFKGPPADFHSAGRDMPGQNAEVSAKLQKALSMVLEAGEILMNLPRAYVDRFYGHVEQMDDLIFELDRAIKGQ